MPVVLLTSIGLSSATVMNRFVELKRKNNLRTCGLIFNAARGASDKYVALATQQLKSQGIAVSVVDIRDKHFGKYDIIYIAGGNTFQLLDHIHQGIGIDKLRDALSESQLVIGVSAGAIILTPTITVASEIQPDKNTVGISDFRALHLIKYEILPHYSHKLHDESIGYQKRYSTQLRSFQDDEYIEETV